MSDNTKPVLDDIASAAQAYRDACSEADTLLAENQRLTAELAEARKHAKVLAYAAYIALEKAPKCFESPQLDAALKWAKEQA